MISFSNMICFFFFSIYMKFIFFVCTVQTFNTILNKSSENEHPFVVPNFRRKALVFHHSVGVLKNFVDDLFQFEVGLLSLYFAENSYPKWMLDFIKFLFFLSRDDRMIFNFIFLTW